MSTTLSELENELYPEEPAALEPAPPRSGSPHRKLRFVVLGLTAAVALGAAWAYGYYRNRVTTDDAQVDGHIVPIAAKISGSVLEVLVRDNQQVKAGELLVRLDPRDYQARVNQARASLALAAGEARAAQIGVPWTQETTQSGTSSAAAQLAAAEAELDRARAAHEQASGADLAYAQANVKARQANYDRARADLERMRPLIAKAEISQQQFDAYSAAAQVAESELAAAREKLAGAAKEAEIRKAALSGAQARVEQAGAALAQSQANHKQVPISAAAASSAEAGVAQARANLEAAELQLTYATITAPVDGVVTKKTVQTGQIIQPGQALLVLIPLRDVWVTANFKETQLAGVRPGQAAKIYVDMYGQSYEGRVDTIAAATGSRLSLLPPENATGNFVKVVQRIPVKIVLEPGVLEQAVLRPGMNVEATIFTR